ncbi:hypothetical protein ACIOML_27600 [Streptomyces anulatus]
MRSTTDGGVSETWNRRAGRVRYAAQHRIADALDAARLLRPVDRRALDGGERWLKDPEDTAKIAGRIAEASGTGPERASSLLAGPEATADSCHVGPRADLEMGLPHFPESEAVGAGPVPGHAMRLLRQRCEAGMNARGLDHDERAAIQLEYELSVIAGLSQGNPRTARSISSSRCCWTLSRPTSGA